MVTLRFTDWQAVADIFPANVQTQGCRKQEKTCTDNLPYRMRDGVLCHDLGGSGGMLPQEKYS